MPLSTVKDGSFQTDVFFPLDSNLNSISLFSEKIRNVSTLKIDTTGHLHNMLVPESAKKVIVETVAENGSEDYGDE